MASIPPRDDVPGVTSEPPTDTQLPDAALAIVRNAAQGLTDPSMAGEQALVAIAEDRTAALELARALAERWGEVREVLQPVHGTKVLAQWHQSDTSS